MIDDIKKYSKIINEGFVSDLAHKSVDAVAGMQTKRAVQKALNYLVGTRKMTNIAANSMITKALSTNPKCGNSSDNILDQITKIGGEHVYEGTDIKKFSTKKVLESSDKKKKASDARSEANKLEFGSRDSTKARVKAEKADAKVKTTKKPVKESAKKITVDSSKPHAFKPSKTFSKNCAVCQGAKSKSIHQKKVVKENSFENSFSNTPTPIESSMYDILLTIYYKDADGDIDLDDVLSGQISDVIDEFRSKYPNA